MDGCIKLGMQITCILTKKWKHINVQASVWPLTLDSFSHEFAFSNDISNKKRRADFNQILQKAFISGKTEAVEIDGWHAQMF